MGAEYLTPASVSVAFGQHVKKEKCSTNSTNDKMLPSNAQMQIQQPLSDIKNNHVLLVPSDATFWRSWARLETANILVIIGRYIFAPFLIITPKDRDQELNDFHHHTFHVVLFWKFLFFKKLNWILLNCILVVVSLWLRNRFFLKRQNGWHREYQNAMRQSTSVASVLLCSSWFLEIFELKSSAAAVPCLCCFTVLFGSFTTQALKKSFFFSLIHCIILWGQSCKYTVKLCEYWIICTVRTSNTIQH